MPRTAQRAGRRAWTRWASASGGEPDGAFYAYVDVGRFTNDFAELLQADAARRRASRRRPGIDFDRAQRQALRALLLCRDAGRRWSEALERMERFLQGT